MHPFVPMRLIWHVRFFILADKKLENSSFLRSVFYRSCVRSLPRLTVEQEQHGADQLADHTPEHVVRQPLGAASRC